jgi:twitching motility protein PilT
MQTFNQSLVQALARRLVTTEEALGRSSDAEELKNLLTSSQGAGRPTSGPVR